MKRKLSAILLSLCMVIGLCAGMNGTALAENTDSIELVSQSADAGAVNPKATVRNNGEGKDITVIMKSFNAQGNIIAVQADDEYIASGASKDFTFTNNNYSTSTRLEFQIVENYGSGIVMPAATSGPTLTTHYALLTNGGEAKNVTVILQVYDAAGEIIMVYSRDEHIEQNRSRSFSFTNHHAAAEGGVEFLVVEDYGQGPALAACVTQGKAATPYAVVINGGGSQSATVSFIPYGADGAALKTYDSYSKTETVENNRSRTYSFTNYDSAETAKLVFLLNGQVAQPIDIPAVATEYSKVSAAAGASSWAKADIMAAAELGLLPKNLQSSYKAPATRAEFCALGVALYETITGEEITGRAAFSDTSDVNVEKMAHLKVVNGLGDGTFGPNESLTREQAATMLSRLSESMGKPLAAAAPTFADNGSIAAWAYDAVGQMQAAGIMGGTGGNTFSPGTDYTREQSIVTFLRLYNALK